MKALLVALTLVPFNVHTKELPAVEVNPLQHEQEEMQPLPQIVMPLPYLVNFEGKKYLCGWARRSSRAEDYRFVFSLETDWQVYEPKKNDPTWESVLQTITSICEAE
jgi:hypothetical protein